MFYTVYKTTNQINGKFYIGTHKTKDPNDSYLGSGKLLKRAIDKYGVDNFKKEVLFVFEDSASMFAKEAELVTDDFLAEHNTYNLKLGGFGGFDYLNSSDYDNPSHSYEHILKMSAASAATDQSYRTGKGIETLRERGLISTDGFRGKTHSEESKARIGAAASQNQSEHNNSQFGRARSEETKRKISETLKKRAKATSD